MICEGKTDIVYLKCALKSLSRDYPQLIKTEDEKLKFSISFLKFSKRLKDVFAISEGTSGLKALMEMYNPLIKRFKASGKKYPVIIILDTDSGNKDILKLLKVKDYDFEFKNYIDNLYVVFISRDKNIEIEDLFDTELLKTKIDGKSFNKKKKHGSVDEYGKHIFAEKVIKPNQETVDFAGFKLLLNNINAAIVNYKNE